MKSNKFSTFSCLIGFVFLFIVVWPTDFVYGQDAEDTNIPDNVSEEPSENDSPAVDMVTERTIDVIESPLEESTAEMPSAVPSPDLETPDIDEGTSSLEEVISAEPELEGMSDDELPGEEEPSLEMDETPPVPEIAEQGAPEEFPLEAMAPPSEPAAEVAGEAVSIEEGETASEEEVDAVSDEESAVASTSETNEKVPEWVRNTARWYGEGTISETEFLNAIGYLIEKGVITTDGKKEE